ncbi:hydrolase 1, exosortase A system-associated [Altererythrobacter sp. C41]|uniref:hydrolase 1, exosortase A system-associated n=1 Tax=Altererythrobacter sp. C41 TaxID=2806021 RepID=UPI0019347FA2|nr:hydrolase 1, exosortase A system-associated [Altererythrobacter sp. C41]MBM0169120.1 hydrolase 1, exosortase A system-associated [Altererythrobacter sp. C41]
MKRLPLTFACEDSTLAGTLDTAPASVGLLIVSGGNEIRAGAFSGQAQLAARIQKAGFPVFRFDRRGVGDSEGENLGFRKSRKDIVAALDAFRAITPQMNRVIGFGNCDAASALMLARGAGCDALVLSNPWTIEGDDDAIPPPEAVRARYAEKLKNPKELARLVTGKVDLGKLARGIAKAALPKSAPSSLAQEIKTGLEAFGGPARILLADADRTAQAFASAWDPADQRVAYCKGATHAYVEPDAREWLYQQLLAALRA